MALITIPNRPAGTDARSIAAILADFDAITNVVNGNLDSTNMSAAFMASLGANVFNLRTSAGGGSTITAAAGDLIVLRGGDTCQMPAPTAGATIRVATALNVLSSAPATVSASVTGKLFYGGGLNGVPSFVLAGPGSLTVTLISDGTAWFLFGGQRDTGWITITPTAQYTVMAAVYVRVTGDRARLQGELSQNATAAAAFNIPAVARPSVARNFPAYGSPATGAGVLTNGDVYFVATGIGNVTALDGSSYPL